MVNLSTLPKVPKGTRVLVTLTVTQSVLYPALTTLIIHTMDLSLYETAKCPVLIEPSSILMHVVSSVEKSPEENTTGYSLTHMNFP